MGNLSHAVGAKHCFTKGIQQLPHHFLEKHPHEGRHSLERLNKQFDLLDFIDTQIPYDAY